MQPGEEADVSWLTRAALPNPRRKGGGETDLPCELSVSLSLSFLGKTRNEQCEVKRQGKFEQPRQAARCPEKANFLRFEGKRQWPPSPTSLNTCQPKANVVVT